MSTIRSELYLCLTWTDTYILLNKCSCCLFELITIDVLYLTSFSSLSASLNCRMVCASKNWHFSAIRSAFSSSEIAPSLSPGIKIVTSCNNYVLLQNVLRKQRLQTRCYRQICFSKPKPYIIFLVSTTFTCETHFNVLLQKSEHATKHYFSFRPPLIWPSRTFS